MVPVVTTESAAGPELVDSKSTDKFQPHDLSLGRLVLHLQFSSTDDLRTSFSYLENKLYFPLQEILRLTQKKCMH